MERSFFTPALVLATRPFGESNISVTILSPERGIFDAVLYGGRKSKMRSLVSPFHCGTMWLYNDTAKKSIKITDFDVQAFHPSLRENLYKNACGSLVAELLMKTRGGNTDNEFPAIWQLATGFLAGLEISSDEDSHLALLRFLWRYLAVLGVQPDSTTCACCGTSLMDYLRQSPQSMVYYQSYRQGFVCTDCSGDSAYQDMYPLCAEALTYLNGVTTLTPAESRRLPVHTGSVRQMHDLLMYLICQAAESRLNTLELGVL
ncbi:MAG: DNA repair protein RecO [Treponemataceae bacterium]|nr:DNA repair protein RecO [Treponemataceae bacterium]